MFTEKNATEIKQVYKSACIYCTQVTWGEYVVGQSRAFMKGKSPKGKTKRISFYSNTSIQIF